MKSNIEVLVNIGLGERAKDDALLVRDTCTILLTLSKSEEKVGNRNKICCKLSKKNLRRVSLKSHWITVCRDLGE